MQSILLASFWLFKIPILWWKNIRETIVGKTYSPLLELVVARGWVMERAFVALFWFQLDIKGYRCISDLFNKVRMIELLLGLCPQWVDRIGQTSIDFYLFFFLCLKEKGRRKKSGLTIIAD